MTLKSTISFVRKCYLPHCVSSRDISHAQFVTCEVRGHRASSPLTCNKAPFNKQTTQTHILRRTAENLQLFQQLDNFSPELKLLRMEENQPESAATGSGGLGTADTSLYEGAEQGSSAVGDRLLVHPNSSFNTACNGNVQTTPKSSNVLVEEPRTIGDRFSFKEKGSRNT